MARPRSEPTTAAAITPAGVLSFKDWFEAPGLASGVVVTVWVTAAPETVTTRTLVTGLGVTDGGTLEPADVVGACVLVGAGVEVGVVEVVEVGITVVVGLLDSGAEVVVGVSEDDGVCGVNQSARRVLNQPGGGDAIIRKAAAYKSDVNGGNNHGTRDEYRY